jgi:hypothetical protein
LTSKGVKKWLEIGAEPGHQVSLGNIKLSKHNNLAIFAGNIL